jgi:hypothetical protein
VTELRAEIHFKKTAARLNSYFYNLLEASAFLFSFFECITEIAGVESALTRTAPSHRELALKKINQHLCDIYTWRASAPKGILLRELNPPENFSSFLI